VADPFPYVFQTSVGLLVFDPRSESWYWADATAARSRDETRLAFRDPLNGRWRGELQGFMLHAGSGVSIVLVPIQPPGGSSSGDTAWPAVTLLLRPGWRNPAFGVEVRAEPDRFKRSWHPTRFRLQAINPSSLEQGIKAIAEVLCQDRKSRVTAVIHRFSARVLHEWVTKIGIQESACATCCLSPRELQRCATNADSCRSKCSNLSATGRRTQG